jgi:hypothetical protein
LRPYETGPQAISIRASICHGNIPLIPAVLFDTSDLDMGDLASDEYFTGLPSEDLLEEHDRKFDGDSPLKFLEVIKLATILRRVLEDR